MTVDINDTPNRIRYVATAAQTVFAVPFEFFANADIKLYQNGTLKTLTTHYTLTGAGIEGGGNLTLVTGATVADDILIIRDIPVERQGDFPVSGPFSVSSLNTQLDKHVAMIRDLETRIERRVLRLSVADLPETLSDLPAKAVRASALLGFDADGDVEVYTYPTALVTAPHQSALDSITWATDYLVSSETLDQRAAMNTLIAAINAGTVKAVYFPGDFIVATSAPFDTITADDWTMFSPGFAEFRMLATAGAVGRFFQIGDTTNDPDNWVIDGFYFNNDNHLSEDGSQWQIEARNCSEGQLRNIRTNNGLYFKGGYSTGGVSYSGTVKHNNIKVLANAGLPNPAYYLLNGGADVYDMYVGALTRNALSNPNFTNALSWTAGPNWTVAGTGAAVKTAGAAGNLSQALTTAELVPGATYNITVDLNSISGGTLTAEIVGTTTATSAAFSTVGDNEFTLVCPAAPTSFRIVGPSGVACSIDDIVVSRITHDSFRPAKLGPDLPDGNIDSVYFSKFDTNGAASKHCLEVDFSYSDIGSVIMQDCYMELSTDVGVVLHSRNAATGFLRGFYFEGGRVTPTQASTAEAVWIDNINDLPVLGAFRGAQISSPRGPAMKITATTPTANMRIDLDGNKFQDRANGFGSAHSLIQVGAGYVTIDGNHLSVGHPNTPPFTLPTCMIDEFVEYTANVPLVHVTNNVFDLATAAEAINTTLVTRALIPGTNYVVNDNVGPTTKGAEMRPVRYNQSVANQAGFAIDTALAGSAIAIPASRLKIGSRYKCKFNIVKTAAGVATPIVDVHFGTTGTVADAVRATLTFAAQSAQIDEAIIELDASFRVVGASAVIQVIGEMRHRAGAGGFGATTEGIQIATSAAFDSTVASSIIHLSVNAGTSAVWTVSLVETSLENLN